MITKNEMIQRVATAMEAWRDRHNVPTLEGAVHSHWHLSQSGYCDDFAQALSWNLSRLGIPNKLCVISRVTSDDSGHEVDRNPFSHAFVSINEGAHECHVDSMGINASQRFFDDWQDDDGQDTQFDITEFNSIGEMRAYLRAPQDGHGIPRSSPENEALISLWTQSLTECLSDAEVGPELQDATPEVDSDTPISIYISVTGYATDPEDEEIGEWYVVDVDCALPGEPTHNLDPMFAHCIHERALDAFHESVAIACLDDFEISVFMEDGRMLSELDVDSDDPKIQAVLKSWDDRISTDGDAYCIGIDDVPVEVEFTASLGFDDPGFLIELVTENPQIAAPGPWGFSALHSAALHGESEVFSALIDAGAQVDQLDQDGLSPLHYATISGNPMQAISALLSCGADINRLSAGGLSPLAYGLQHSGGRSGALWLIASGAKVDDCDQSISIDANAVGTLALMAPENTIRLSEVTPKVAATLGAFIPRLLDLLKQEPQALHPQDEPRMLREIAKRADLPEVISAIDAHSIQQVFQGVRRKRRP